MNPEYMHQRTKTAQQGGGGAAWKGNYNVNLNMSPVYISTNQPWCHYDSQLFLILQEIITLIGLITNIFYLVVIGLAEGRSLSLAK